MITKSVAVFTLALSLIACASVPPAPHCKDNGNGLRPINATMTPYEQSDQKHDEAMDKEHSTYDAFEQGGNNK